MVGLRTGAMRHTIKLKFFKTVRDAIGGQSNEETPYKTVTIKSDVRPLTGKEVQSNDRQLAVRQNLFIIHYRTDVTPETIIEHNGVDYDITYIREVGYKNGLEISGESRI